MLYRPELHEPLTESHWDDARVRDAISAIVADADDAFDERALWPAHEWDGWHAALPLKNLYVGAAGVVWALDELRRLGLAESRLDLVDVSRRTLDAWRDEPDFIADLQLPQPPESALLTGESGILLVAWLVAPSDELADALLARVRANIGNAANELMWGAPGTLLAARVLLDRTGEERWRAAVAESAETVWTARDDDGRWTQQLYGTRVRSLGPPHGLVGIVATLLPALDDARADRLRSETAAILAEQTTREDGLANWPSPMEGGPHLQWCAGAPGIVGTAAGYLDEELVVAGAELVWQAAPPGLEKGAGICHGTAGNGHALLKAFARTGDERWLERARAFAMHALEQVDRLRRQNGRGRFSLWTGDVGVALFAASCLAAHARYPFLD